MTWLRRSLTDPLMLLLVAVGALLRLFTIGAKTVWLDEAFSIWVANHSLPDVWLWLIRIDQHPPLYYSLLHFWQLLFGDLQGTVRTFSAICGILTLPVFYAATRRLFDQATALIALLILTFSPFHIHFAQETRMYALLTLLVALAIYCLAHILQNRERRELRWAWLGLAITQAAIMLTHNTATVFFPLALNLAIGGAVLWQYWRGGVSSWPALNDPAFERQWLRGQLWALIFWLPWSIPFILQARLVDHEFWIQPPTMETIWNTLHNFNFAFLPGWVQPLPIFDFLCWGLALLGIFALRRTPARVGLLVAFFLAPFLGELLVSLRRPIFYDRTLIWTTLAYYLLVAVGIRELGSYRWRETKALHPLLVRLNQANQFGVMSLARLVQMGCLLLLTALSLLSLSSYYFYFEKEDWAKAAGYVAQNVQPGDVVVFNATWVQIPFDYYFRHYQTQTTEYGLPVNLFDRGVLEPKMAESDVPYMHNLLADHPRVWLVYSHDWYTDPNKIIPRELDAKMRRVEERKFEGLQVLRFEGK